MAAQRMEGQVVAEAVFADLKKRIGQLKERGVTPGLGTILVGDDAPSRSYVKKKHETSEAIGVRSFHKDIPASATQAELLAAIDDFNADDEVSAFILQYPLPSGFDFGEAMRRVDPAKDADGLHPTNLGRLVLQEPGPVPCTPAGIKAMLEHYQVDIKGREVVVVGRGPTLGRPLSLLLSSKAQGANAAVTVVHSGVSDIAHYTRRADIVIAAVGRPSIITKDMIKPGAVVVSGGISWQGKRLLPDVDEQVSEVASLMTKRLGGVGPTTVAMLLKNTVEAAENTLEAQE